MGYTASTVHGIEVPNSAEANDVPEDIGKVVTALEGGSIIRRLTSAAIAALTAPQKPAGLVVYNTTTNKLQISDASAFSDLDAVAVAALPKTGGTMSGAIAMGSNKVTGLAAASANGDAVRYEQLTEVAARFGAGSVHTTAAVHGATITPPAGKSLSRVVVSVSGTSSYFLANNGYQQVVVSAEIQTPATGAVNILRYGVGSGSSTTALTIYVDYIAYFA